MTTNARSGRLEQKLTAARTHLLLDSPWFGALALRLHVEADATGQYTQTMGTDGTSLWYAPAWAARQTDAQLVGVLAHEVLHCALLHPYRTGTRDLAQWNQACDFAINGLLAAQKFVLPDGAYLDSQYDGLSAEQIYARLSQNPQQPSPEPQPDFSRPKPATPSPTGQKAMSAGQQPAQLSEIDWQIASEQAALAARKAGSMPGDVDRQIRETRQSTTDWRTLLRRFLENVVPSDYSWTHPNRRYIARGIYLPGVVRENMPALGIAVDTSGSIDAPLLAQFGAELTAILHELHPASLDIVYCDSHIQGAESFSPDDPEVVFHPKGGGGTNLQPPLDYFTDADMPPAAVLYFTDLDARMPKEPDYPVLWIIPERSNRQAPFGERVSIVLDR